MVYNLVTTNKKRTKAELKNASTHAVFELDLSFALKDLSSKAGKHSIIMRRPSAVTTTVSGADHSSIVGTCDISFGSMSTPIHLGIGDLEGAPATVVWENLRCRDKWRTNGFELEIDLGAERGRRVFYWKRTHDGTTAGSFVRRLVSLDMEMVNRESGTVVARFAHHLLFGSRRGAFELNDFDGGKDWETIVLLSGCAVLEYMRKVFGLSW